MTPPPSGGNGPKRPTLGQRTQLERISTAAWVLVGEQAHAGALITYRLIERGTGRELHTLTAAMVVSLEVEGWIACVGPKGTQAVARRWMYRITQAGIEARDRGFAAETDVPARDAPGSGWTV